VGWDSKRLLLLLRLRYYPPVITTSVAPLLYHMQYTLPAQPGTSSALPAEVSEGNVVAVAGCGEGWGGRQRGRGGHGGVGVVVVRTAYACVDDEMM
jgi:hypothetical protein